MTKEPRWKSQELETADVRQKPEFQNRVKGIDGKHVQTLTRQLEKDGRLAPIEVAKIGKALYVVEGFHRLEVYKATGRKTIDAKVAQMTLSEAKDWALLANTTHGKNLSQADKASIFQRYIVAGRHVWSEGETMPVTALAGTLKSSRAISADINGIYSHETVRTKLKARGLDLDVTVEFPGGYKPRQPEEDMLVSEIRHEAIDSLWDFERHYQSLEMEDQQELLGIARGIIQNLEDGKKPNRVTECTGRIGLDI
ncbi:ParB/RepB/Spo0J family partition protein [Sphingorhabdus sp. YGSMI21]|uniref:ParB/RepB/Spo0J family partition protein n=1 Tax=Sphingorhabdus sp. YGSMI21 TaxID=2077182 RepID=UPI0013D9E717|nr:ParB/RepB/Spo0J family partition protein [Sphingorhabdus sp. YGSMI21]